MDGGYSAERPDQGGGGSSDWLLISRASLTPSPSRFAAECPTASGHPEGLLVPATKTIPYVYSHYWPAYPTPFARPVNRHATRTSLPSLVSFDFSSFTATSFFFSSQRVVKEEGEAQRTNIEFEDTRVRKTERERKQDRLLGIDIEVSKGTRSYSLAWKASRSGRSPLRRIRRR